MKGQKGAMTLITCHALDAAAGRHAAGVRITLWRLDPDGQRRLLFDQATDAEGRLHLAVDLDAELPGVVCELVFDTGAYLAASKGPEPIQQLALRFVPRAATARYHFPLSLTSSSQTVLMLALS